MNRRLMPAAVAALVIAIVITALWWTHRTAPIPTTPPAAAPAVDSYWQVDGAAIGGQLPFPGSPVPCTASHTAEVFYVGQVDHNLIRTARTASGQQATVAKFVMTTAARSGCIAKAATFLGGAWRGAQLSIYPDFVSPFDDGFYACVAAQVSGPAADRPVARSASLASALSGPDAATLEVDCVTTPSGSSALVYVPCVDDHTAEFVGLYTSTPLGAPYNGDELKSAVTGGCTSLVDGFLGLAPGQKRSDLHVSQVGPDSSTLWVGSDQTFACYATASRAWRGSVKGLGTRPLQH